MLVLVSSTKDQGQDWDWGILERYRFSTSGVIAQTTQPTDRFSPPHSLRVSGVHENQENKCIEFSSLLSCADQVDPYWYEVGDIHKLKVNIN